MRHNIINNIARAATMRTWITVLNHADSVNTYICLYVLLYADNKSSSGTREITPGLQHGNLKVQKWRSTSTIRKKSCSDYQVGWKYQLHCDRLWQLIHIPVYIGRSRWAMAELRGLYRLPNGTSLHRTWSVLPSGWHQECTLNMIW